MRALKLFTQSEGSLIADYASRMSEALSRRNAEIEVRAARMEADLAIKARSEFLANMNHELRTPLNAIIGFATMLRDTSEYDLDEEQRGAYAAYILQSADLLLGHINTVLEVAALESGGVELNDDVVDFCVLLMEALERAHIRAEAGDITIDRRDSGEDVIGWGDAERVSQAVDHLLQTAIKACGVGGNILVRANVNEFGWAEIAVRDDGEGLSPEALHAALEAFKQVHRGLDRSFSGPGIGYAIAKTFIEMQGGRFSIKSQPGQGTLVRISLPPPEQASPASDGEEADEDETGANQIKNRRVHDAA
ncbi:MAG: HAMP domain-containing sensor histidine kinase [Pseudomonadota bacterium]